MLRPRLVLALALAASVPLAGCLEGKGGAAAGDDPDAAALAFSLRVVETYFAQDAEAFLGMLADEVYTLEGDGPFTRADVEAWVTDEPPFPAGRDYSAHDLEEYLATYEPVVLTWDEAVARHPEAANLTWDGWRPDGDDRVFLGWEVKEGKEPFLWDDLLAFVVSSESGEWRFKAFGG